MKKLDHILIRALTVTDLHQSELHYASLEKAITKYKPQVVFIIGDFLDVGCQASNKLPVAHCAQFLSMLPAEHLLFLRGNHEDINLMEFVSAWRHDLRPLKVIYGRSHQVGPLTAVGFPCELGSDLAWCAHLSRDGDTLQVSPPCNPQPPLGQYKTWLPRLLNEIGPSGRALWLAHECPVGLPLSTHPNFELKKAVENYLPALVVSGHDHNAPQRSGTWRVFSGATWCINVGQSATDFHFALFDFEFSSEQPCLPRQVTVRAWPWGESFSLKPGHQR